MDFIIFLAIGIAAGLLSGLLGIGGGIIVVPTLLMLFHHNQHFHDTDMMHIAVGTSLATMILTALSSTIAYQRHQAIIWPVFWRMLPGLCLGLVAGSTLTKQLVSTVLVNLFSAILTITAIQLIFSAHQQAKTIPRPIISCHSSREQLLIFIGSLIVGILSSLFGIGGGILLVPLFLMLGLTMRQSSGTSSICGMITAIIGTLLLSRNTLNSQYLYPHTIGYIYWPAALTIAIGSVCMAPFGTSLAFKLPIPALKRLFSIILLLSAWNLLTF